jgi:predicted transcriptional regulator YdeE
VEIEVRSTPVELDLYGLSGDVPNYDYGGTGKALMDEMWGRIKAAEVQTKGINYWVYFSADRMMTAVELEDGPGEAELEHRTVRLDKYAYFKHIGPYEQLHKVHQAMEEGMGVRGLKEIGPRVEKYGHWTNDATQLVTEIFIAVE